MKYTLTLGPAHCPTPTLKFDADVPGPGGAALGTVLTYIGKLLQAADTSVAHGPTEWTIRIKKQGA